MPAFYFEASDANGRIIKNVIEADSIKHARVLLREKGLLALTINIEDNKQANKKTVSISYLIDFTRQCATLLMAGLSIDQALQLLVKDKNNNQIQSILETIKSEVNAGQSFSNAIKIYPKVFSNLYISLVSAGEESGKLDIVMLELADYLEEQQKLAQQIQNAFIYPAIVTCVAISIIVFLMTYIIPQVVGVFNHSKQKLPVLTQIMLFLSNIISNYGIYILIVSSIFIVIIKYLLLQPNIKFKWHALQLKLPIFKQIILGHNTARFSSTLSILTKAGIPILRALQAGNNTLSNLQIKQQVHFAIEQVTQGISLAKALKNSAFPLVMIHLIKVGENTGQLANMLAKISQQQTQQLRRYTLFLTTLLEPLLILIMGIIVMLIVLAVLLPIMELNQILR